MLDKPKRKRGQALNEDQRNMLRGALYGVIFLIVVFVMGVLIVDALFLHSCCDFLNQSITETVRSIEMTNDKIPGILVETQIAGTHSYRQTQTAATPTPKP
jgi:hypothetical protein